MIRTEKRELIKLLEIDKKFNSELNNLSYELIIALYRKHRDYLLLKQEVVK